jgi:hypothetical protein
MHAAAVSSLETFECPDEEKDDADPKEKHHKVCVKSPRE